MIVATFEFALRPGAEREFDDALEKMLERVRLVDGYLGEEPCRSLADEAKLVTVVYWRDEAALAAWRDDPEHVRMQKQGREKFFAWYKIRIARLEREYGWESSPT